MKKKVIFIVLAIIIIITTAILYINSSNNKKSSNILFIDVNTLVKKVENKDSFVLVLTQDGCAHCKNYAPVIEKVANKYDIKIYDINLTKVKKEDIAKLNAIANTNGTPTTIFFKNGEEETTLNRINGATSEDKLVKKLEKLGYIKGE